MIFRSTTDQFPLSAEGIDAMSDRLMARLEEMGVQRRNQTLIRLALEEALLVMMEHPHEDSSSEFRLAVGSTLSASFARLEHKGLPHNPLAAMQDAEDVWGASLLNSMGLRPQYSYVGGTNVLHLSFDRRHMNPALALLIGIAVGALTGILGLIILPQQFRDLIAGPAIDFAFDLWIRTLNAIAGPVIFFMVITTLLNTKKVEERGGNKLAVVTRYFVICFFSGLVAVGIAVLAYAPNIQGDVLGIADARSMLKGALSIIPKHILEPFSTSNTPQLMLVAFVLGNAIIALGARAKNLAKIVRQFNMAGSLVTTWVSMLVPAVTGMLLALEIWNHTEGFLIQIWKPMLLGLAISVISLCMGVAYIHLRLGVDMRTFVHKIREPFLVALRTGTLDAAYGETEFSCNKRLGIEMTFTKVTLPQGLVLFMPASIIGTLVFTVFAAREYGIEISLWWCLVAAVLDVLLFVATPPVPGANLLAFITLFELLGIPRDAFLDAMIFDIVFGLFANAANQAILQIELVLQADHLGLLDHEVLLRK